jgi:nucleoid-associated protein YgaU
MADYNVRGEMTLATGSFIASAKAASASLNGLNTSAIKTSGGMDLLGGTMKKLAAGALAAYIVKLGRDSVKAAQVAGAAQNRLRMLLLATGGATEDQIKILNQQAAALEQMTVVSKDNITVVQSQLATFDLGSKAIATMTPAILDYVVAEKGAAASADEYRSMTNGLALALNGQFGALTRVGFVLDAKTKQDIKSGTEMERAAAIVRVLNSTYKDFAATAGDTAAGAQQKLSTQIGNLKQSFGEALLPTIMKVQGFMANTLLPTINGLMAKFKDGTAVQKFITFIGGLLKNLYDFGSAIAQVVGPILANVLIPAFIAVGAAIVGVIKVLGAIGSFMKKHMEAFQVVAQVVVGAAMAYGAYRLAVMAGLAIQKIHTAYTIASTTATTAFTTAQRMLNATMAFNPIALAVGALVALAAGFVIAWNHSETFRKVIIAIGKAGVIAFGYIIEWIGKLATGAMKVATGPLTLLLKGLALLKVPGAKEALNGITKAIDGVGTFFDNAAKSVKGYADKLDSLANKKISLPKFTMPKGGTSGIGLPDISGLDPGNTEATVDAKAEKAAAALAAKLVELKQKLTEVVQGYNDFIVNDFAAGFVKGSETARDTMLKGLDELKNVFDAQQAIFEAQNNSAGLAKVKSEWDSINNYVRSRIAEAMAIAAELEDVENKLQDAYSRLKDAVQARTEGAKAFGEMLRTPFGQPSDIQKAMASGETTVDGIISMYDKMRDAIDKRFTDIGGNKKNELINLLTDQTTKLVNLAKRREAAAKALDEAQKHLDDVLSQQASFKSNITDSIKSFGSALADLSKSNSDTTIRVIKTASGLVITQMNQGSTGVAAITDKLKASLATIKDFTANIQLLLVQGYNKEYVRSLLEAGPEAAGATAALLAKSGSDTMNTVNDLYTQINSASEVFGSTMSETFYGNAVSMAKAMVNGAESEYKSIMDEMKKIADGIEAAFTPLADVGTNVGNDIVQDLINALERRRAELISLANAIAAQVAAAMAAAAGAIGVTVSGSITPNSGSSTTTTETTPTPEPSPQPTPTTPQTPSETTPKAVATAAATASKVIVKAGDTLSSIAKSQGTTLSAILAANPKFTDVAKYQGGNMIWSGTTVNIPAPAPSTVYGGFSNDAANTAKYAGSSSTTTVEKGAVTVNLGSNIPANDVEPIMTRALLNALGAR